MQGSVKNPKLEPILPKPSYSQSPLCGEIELAPKKLDSKNFFSDDSISVLFTYQT